tara:strand:+ start:132 stop:689 length:558 start_codon:yes stop_codon:yes gene_type:complete
MAITIKDILVDPSGAPSPFTSIEVKTVIGYTSLKTTYLNPTSGPDGSIEFDLVVGKYEIYTEFNGAPPFKQGEITVTDDLYGEYTLQLAMDLMTPLLPAQVIEVKELVEDAANSAAEAEESAQEAKSALDQVMVSVGGVLTTSRLIAESITIRDNSDALSIGRKITIADDAIVTIGNNSEWWIGM